MLKYKICPACKCANPETEIFCICNSCKVDLSSERAYNKSEIDIFFTKRCPYCNTYNNADAIICGKCKKPLDEVKARDFLKDEQSVLPSEDKIKSENIEEKSSKSTIAEFSKNSECVLTLATIEGKAIEISGDKKTILGREGDISSDLFTSDLKVSRKHLIVELEDQKWYILDNKSTNGTYLNGNKLKVKQRYSIKKDDVINLSTHFTLVVKKI